MGKGLGHTTENHLVFHGHCVRRHLEQLVAIRRRQCIIKTVIDFVLATGIFMVHLLQIESQFSQVVAHVFQELAVAVNRFQVGCHLLVTIHDDLGVQPPSILRNQL